MKGTSLLVLVLCISFVGLCQATVANTIYTINLTPQQVVDVEPVYENEHSYGLGFCFIQRYNETYMNCTIQHNVDELQQATINSGFRGETGQVLYSFPITQKYKLHGIYFFDNSTLNTLLDGGWYVNLIARDFPLGQIRGQIEQQDRFYAYLNPQNSIPRATGTSAAGVAVATYSYDSRVIDIDLVHSVTATSSTQLGLGAAGQPGVPLRTYFGDSPLHPYSTLTRLETENLFEDEFYLSVLSHSNPLGDIRGQLDTIDYIQAGFSSALSGSANGTGNAIFSYNCNTQVLEYVIVHSVQNVFNATMVSRQIGRAHV